MLGPIPITVAASATWRRGAAHVLLWLEEPPTRLNTPCGLLRLELLRHESLKLGTVERPAIVLIVLLQR